MEFELDMKTIQLDYKVLCQIVLASMKDRTNEYFTYHDNIEDVTTFDKDKIVYEDREIMIYNLSIDEYKPVIQIGFGEGAWLIDHENGKATDLTIRGLLDQIAFHQKKTLQHIKLQPYL